MAGNIRMPKELADKWLTALRSGEYKQAKEVLYDEKTNGYCCLGVLQKCISGEIVPDPSGEVPDRDWLDSHDIKFIDMCTKKNLVPYIEKTKLHITVENDNGKSFDQIADLIESELEYTDGEGK